MSQTKAQLIAGSSTQSISASNVVLSGATSGTVTIAAPAAAGSNTLTLPTGNGTAGQFLQTNGSGALSFAGAGKILQVVQTAKLDAFTSSSTSFTDVTGLSVTITPVAASSKILVEASFVVSNADGGRSMYFNLVRGSTTIAQPSAGNANDATIQCNTTGPNFNIVVAKVQFLDEPTYTLGNSITYKIQCKTDSGTLCVGRRGDRSNELSISPITAMEVSD